MDSSLERCRVLHVDDDADVREAVRCILEDAGYTVSSVGDGRQGLDALDTLTLPCVILLDLMMPVVDGWEFLRELQQSPDFAHLPVTITTAYDAIAVDAPGLVLSKPFTVNQLLDALARPCRHARSPHPRRCAHQDGG